MAVEKYSAIKRTFYIDTQLLKEAKEACGALTDVEVVHRGLQALVQHAASQRLLKLGGILRKSKAKAVPRRREPAARKPRRIA